jgi:hypothetical protein
MESDGQKESGKPKASCKAPSRKRSRGRKKQPQGSLAKDEDSPLSRDARTRRLVKAAIKLWEIKKKIQPE